MKIAMNGRALGLALSLSLLCRVDTSHAEPAAPLGFEVRYNQGLVESKPVTARVFVMLSPPLAPGDPLPSGENEPRFGPNWFKLSPIYAKEVTGWNAGQPLLIDTEADGFPGPLSAIPAGTYAAQSVVRLNQDTAALGDGEGNLFGPVKRVTIDPVKGGIHELPVTARVPSNPLHETDRIKLVNIPSPMLSAFYHRPIRHRAALILPDRSPGELRPALYIVPGFSGDHHRAALFAGEERFAYGKEMIRVILDPSCGTGHHVFADSATNGPRGRALVEELIPHIERTYHAIPEPSARLLNGHSSGGWSTLWLQVNYPDFFGGTWSTAPDPVDFRDFLRANLYQPGENLYYDAAGDARPVARLKRRIAIYLQDFCAIDDVLATGGQMSSFEAVFSPVGPDGKPRKLWDRQTGMIDNEVAKAWRAYDIRLILEKNWKTLEPRLSGKIHVYMGDRDTFVLDGSTRLLKQSLQTLGASAVVEMFPDRNHSDLLDKSLADRIDREMKAALAAHGVGLAAAHR